MWSKNRWRDTAFPDRKKLTRLPLYNTEFRPNRFDSKKKLRDWKKSKWKTFCYYLQSLDRGTRPEADVKLDSNGSGWKPEYQKEQETSTIEGAPLQRRLLAFQLPAPVLINYISIVAVEPGWAAAEQGMREWQHILISLPLSIAPTCVSV